MTEHANAPLAPRTTLRLGGPARRLVEAHTETELVELVRRADADGVRSLVLGGGSNVVLPDAGFDGLVVVTANRGVTARGEVLTAQAGEPWDPFVQTCVSSGLAGVEALSGIPGTVGSSPVQNIGAYGQEVASTIRGVRAYDRPADVVVDLAPEACGFGYRTSVFKHSSRYVVIAVTLALSATPLSMPVAYAELARSLGVEVGARVPLADVRAAVLALRRRKGMVIDDTDPDTVSVGSFFTNPVLDPVSFAALEQRVLARLGPDVPLPRFAAPDGRVKVSAAWLIERAGFGKGYGSGPVRISTKHTLALTHRGGGTTAELLGLAREVRDGVRAAFGVELVPEPVLVGGVL